MTAFAHGECHLSLRGVLLTVQGLPTDRAWENVEYKPKPGTPYLEEEYVPAAQSLHTTTKGIVEVTGLYIVKWHGLDGQGDAAIHAGVDAILTVFAAGASFAMPSGLTLRIRGDVAPSPGQIVPEDGGFATCAMTIPWRVYASSPSPS